VQQLAAAFEGGLNLCKSFDCNQGASKLAHSKGFPFHELVSQEARRFGVSRPKIIISMASAKLNVVGAALEIGMRKTTAIPIPIMPCKPL
jgi:hypothetical protein